MFQDEARFGRINDPRLGWAPHGLRPEVPVQIVRESTYLFGATSPHDGVLDTLILPEVKAEAMSLFLAEVAERHSQDYIVMVLDGAGWHRARELVTPPNMRLVFLPPYSPELNPMEYVWEEMRKKWFPNLVFNSLEAVEDRLAQAALCLESHRQIITPITGFDWIVNISLTAT